MSFNDSLSDMLARIKNAHQTNKKQTYCILSKLNKNVLNVLKEEGYIRNYIQEEVKPGVSKIKIELKYFEGSPVIKKIKRVSRPGIRVYSKIGELSKPHGGLGISIISTSKGVMSDQSARAKNVGGEVLCEVF